MQPTKAVIQTTDLIDEAIGKYLQAQSKLRDVQRYESNVESTILFSQTIRHVEAICALARLDLVLLPSALVLARACFEVTGRVLWMLYPEKVFDRESRYLAHLGGEEDFYRRVSVLVTEFGGNGDLFKDISQRIHGFRTEVEELLPSNVKRLASVPKFRPMLKEVGEERRYGNYMRLSQFTHGCHAAGELYRKDLGNGKKYGEFIYPESWSEPLKCAWWCFATGGNRVLERLGGQQEEFFSTDFLTKITESLNKV